MRVLKCDRCKGELPPETNQTMRNIYNISSRGIYMDLCDNCYYKLVRFINNVDRLSKIESVISNWALGIDDNEHKSLERIAAIIREGTENDKNNN